MPDEVGTEATRPDAPDADDGPGGDAADDRPAAPAGDGDSTDNQAQEKEGTDDTGEQDAKAEAAEGEQGSEDGEDEAASTDDLKVVVSIKGGKATIGVQKPSSDPHIETFEDRDLTELAQAVPAVTERARARWEDELKHPAYAKPVPVRSRSRRGRGAAQATTAEGEVAQQATLRLD